MKLLNNGKRLLALLLVLVLAAALVPGKVQAADIEEGKCSIQVNGLEGTVEMTVSAYMIIQAQFDYTVQQPTDPMYKWDPQVADWLKAIAAYQGYIDESGMVTQDFIGLSAADAAAFYDMLAAAIRANPASFSGPKGQQKTTGTSCVLSDLPMGNYLVLVEGGAMIYRPSAVNRTPKWDQAAMAWRVSNEEIVLKSSSVSIDKKVDDVKLKNVGIGDTVPYKVTAQVPVYPDKAVDTTYIISDTLPDAVTLKKTGDKADITVCSDEAGNTVLKEGADEAYTLTTETNGFILTFNYENIKNFSNIYVSYSGIINENAKPNTKFTNTVDLKYNNNPYISGGYKEDTDKAEVYTYGIRLTKTGESDALLPGAVFNLSADSKNSTPLKFLKDADGYYVSADPAAKADIETDADGFLQIRGLKEGTWYLTEVKAPAGYIKPSTAVKVVLQKKSDENPLLLENGDSDGYYPVTVKNRKGFSLPTTGGVGTILFSAGGIVMVGLGVAVICLLLKKKRTA